MNLTLFSLLAFFFVSCVTLEEYKTYEAVFASPYSLVWQSIQVTIKDYPIKKSQSESGQILTKPIKGYSVWRPPPGSIKNKRNRHYTLKILLHKGVVDLNPAVKVQVIKEEFIHKDFIEEAVPAVSNGLEEEVILYRIGRELHLAEEKRKHFERKTKPPPDDEEDIQEELVL